MTKIKAILVDPETHSVSLIELSRTNLLEETYKAVGAETLDVVRAENYFGGQGGAFLYVDDNGLYRKNPAFTLVNQTPIAGKFVILREVEESLDDDSDDDSWAQGVDFTVDAVYERIRFTTPDIAKTLIEKHTAAAAAAYISRDLKVERIGDALFITPKEK